MQVIGDYPLPSALTAFGVGLGLGLLTMALWPGPTRQRDVAFAQKMLDAMSRMVPDALAKRMS